MPTDPALARFAGIRAWVFDLDDTLYPHHTGLFEQVSERILLYVERQLSCGREQALAVRADFCRRHGTTLRGLIVEHGIDPAPFLDFVHDIDHSKLEADPALVATIERLPGRRFVLTNGSQDHAERILARLGFRDPFDDIFDIIRADFVPKPHPDTYARFLGRNGIDPASAAMFEDLPRNLEVPKSLGMATVLVVPRGTAEAPVEAWEARANTAHIDHQTDDLPAFLARIAPNA
ncbi:pyrimidine 5'-nucleotidase [Kaistia defluvii]|uniref:pyrimidine 5'-nucleotidase n=1 Tax=Kaistia defluvii TaxID=410841 RepID=UPI0022500DBB|nr:pyrimidine 5'-nucleotidase [Kaistia defluvii]MCX5520772.1 pyrimidine 5'-nucleotidase [Kaistia defluvii]